MNCQIRVSDLDQARGAVLSGITETCTGSMTAAFDTDWSSTAARGEYIGTVASGLTMEAAASVVDGKSITTVNGTIEVTDLDQTLAADLSGITETGTGSITAAFDTNGTFIGDLGDAVVTVASGVTMEAAASVVSGKSITSAVASTSGTVVVSAAADEIVLTYIVVA